MPAVTVKSLQTSEAYLTSILNEHTMTPNCQYLAERVASFISTMLTTSKFKVPLLTTPQASKETLDSGLIDIRNPAERNESNIDKVTITLMERKLARIHLMSEQISITEEFFRSYLSTSWTVRTYVNIDQNEGKAKALLRDFDVMVDKVLVEIVMGEVVVEEAAPVRVMSFLLPLLIIVFVIVLVGEKMDLFRDIFSPKGEEL